MTAALDQFTGRTPEELIDMAGARGLDVPPDATPEELRGALRQYREGNRLENTNAIVLASRERQALIVDRFTERIDCDVRAVLADGALWTVRGIRAATFHSGEEVRASLTRVGARGDGTGSYYLPAERRDRTAASGGNRG
jgi:hypothetical protein